MLEDVNPMVQTHHHNLVCSCRCLLIELLALTGNGALDEKIGDKAGVGQGGLGDRGSVVLLQPGCNGGPLVGVPITCYHWLDHHILQWHRYFSTQPNGADHHLEQITFHTFSTYLRKRRWYQRWTCNFHIYSTVSTGFI